MKNLSALLSFLTINYLLLMPTAAHAIGMRTMTLECNNKTVEMVIRGRANWLDQLVAYVPIKEYSYTDKAAGIELKMGKNQLFEDMGPYEYPQISLQITKDFRVMMGNPYALFLLREGGKFETYVYQGLKLIKELHCEVKKIVKD